MTRLPIWKLAIGDKFKFSEISPEYTVVRFLSHHRVLCTCDDFIERCFDSFDLVYIPPYEFYSQPSLF